MDDSTGIAIAMSISGLSIVILAVTGCLDWIPGAIDTVLTATWEFVCEYKWLFFGLAFVLLLYYALRYGIPNAILWVRYGGDRIAEQTEKLETELKRYMEEKK